MKYEEYLDTVKNRYANDVYVESLKSTQFYEEKFEIKWIATKLKQYSFVKYEENVNPTKIEAYSKECAAYALDVYKGLPRGAQNAVVSFAVLATENVTNEVIAFIKNAPKKHWAAFEMPVVVDLKNEKLYYLEKTPMWGAIYYKHFREYIAENFSIR